MTGPEIVLLIIAIAGLLTIATWIIEEFISFIKKKRERTEND